jgi:hypothetical protein
MLEIYQAHGSNMKVKITTAIDQYFRKSFNISANNELGHSAWGWFNEQEEMSMFVTRSHWSSMPYATIGNVFADRHKFSMLKENLHVINEFLTPVFLDSANNFGRKVCYMARDYQHTKSTVKGIHRLGPESRNHLYDVKIVEIVPPYSRAKYEFGSNILGILEGRNPTPVIIKSYTLKSEHDPEVSVLKDAEHLIN